MPHGGPRPNSGGARPGAGRPSKGLTRVLHVRIPAQLYEELAEAVYALRDGEAAVMDVDEDSDPRLIRWLREQAAAAKAAHDLDLEDQLLGIAACIERALARQRRRNTEEMHGFIEGDAP